ncbi:pYEATS domain-containing protein [Shewanella sp. 6_MG-2023]|uniref:pYEATS domain-containing protein n=1 Tax=Shewanella sp. 6_MG-2023 TaxID=3062660 RepID=UPI0026E1CF76|nr:pYEATS domain-containing protein [Shewanella sp. 6_MG-2023]MDO6621087.1 hypothetical protein [Shewanella sp. 6_MG-2023]
MENIEYLKIQKSSILSAGLSLFGFIIILSSLGFSYNEIKDKELQVKNLTELEESLQLKIDNQRDIIRELEIASSPTAIVAQSNSVELEGIKDGDGRQIYDFSIFLQVPILLKEKITEVNYFFNHPSMLKPNRKSTNYANGYNVSYRGWGCLTKIEITVHIENGKNHKIYYNQCAGNQTAK